MLKWNIGELFTVDDTADAYDSVTLNLTYQCGVINY